MSQQIPPRSEVPIEHTWDAASVFPNDAAWETEYTRVVAAIDGLDEYRGRLGDSPALLAEWLDTVCALEHQVARLTLKRAETQRWVHTTECRRCQRIKPQASSIHIHSSVWEKVRA